MSIYGHYDISGCRDDEPEPCPRVYDPIRKVWSDAWKDHLFEHEITHYNNLYDKMNFRLADKLPDPKKLIEIAEAGVKDPVLATCAFGELLNQCYNSDKFQTLVCVDHINIWKKPTQYPTFRYSDYRKLNDKIPPYHLALVRLLNQFDGHYIRNGFKAMAMSHYRQFNHIVTPEEIGYHTQGYSMEVENMTLNDFRHAMRYYGYIGLFPNHYEMEWRLENMFMETQGNLSAFHRSRLTYSDRAYLQ